MSAPERETWLVGVLASARAAEPKLASYRVNRLESYLCGLEEYFAAREALSGGSGAGSASAIKAELDALEAELDVQRGYEQDTTALTGRFSSLADLFVWASRSSAVGTDELAAARACLIEAGAAKTLADWLASEVKTTGADAQRLCLQVPEAVAARHLQQTQALLGEMRKRQIKLALEHFGAGRDSHGLLNSLAVDFIKIDGSLMQGLTANLETQERVRTLVEAAARRAVQTVAERIEDANTMAVVWQLGVQYIQGYLVHAPEEVVLKS